MDGERKDEVYLAALAGLLHDVGKFAQRADWQKGQHTEVGGEVVRQYVPTQWREYLYPVMGHHDRPLTGYETKVVALADRLSAGERADEKQEQPKQLLPIFYQVTTEDVNGQTQRVPGPLYWPLKSLSLNRDVLFPNTQMPDAAVRQGYDTLWRSFTEELALLQKAHPTDNGLPMYLEGLSLLMQRYTWCIPSAYYRSLPDVSLYDHSRMTAALAACITGKSEATLDQVLRAPEQSTESMAVLVGGDISGVQDFIYTITDRGATSALRGRSFYLQLLTETVARYVLRRLKLPITNLIYQGGGAFYLLARADDSSKLREIQQEISHVLLAHHRGDLYLALANVPLVAADFYGGRISGKWEELALALRGVKQQRFAELDEEGLIVLFEAQGHGGSEDQQCQVCGQEHPQTKAIKKRPEDENEVGTRKCPQCLAYEDLGYDLRRAHYLWLAELEPRIPDKPLEITPGEWSDVLAAFGFQGGVVRDWREVPPGDSRLILALNDDVLKELRPDEHTTVGRRFLVNVAPTITQTEINALHDQIDELPTEGSVKPFSVLEAQSSGIKRLGVLRMDVDNLGNIFAKGLGEAATLSRVAALSFAISLYFEGWVGQIAEAMNAETRAERGDTLYSIYSGGDDLFFVGAWDVVVELARRIRADLTSFAANHPGIHTSAGIVLVGGKYPLAQAAQDAGKAEKEAKGRSGKNALSFLDQVTSWERFGLEACTTLNLETVHGMAHHLGNLVQAEDGPKALLRLLMSVQEQHDEAARKRRARGDELNRSGEEQTLYGPWLWRGYYNLKRMVGRYKRQPDIQDALLKLAERLHDQQFRDVEWIGLAARWAELLERKS